jgi:hypothetical protein
MVIWRIFQSKLIAQVLLTVIIILECHLTCLTCIDQPSKCVSCDISSTHRYLVGTTCPCDKGFLEFDPIKSVCDGDSLVLLI